MRLLTKRGGDDEKNRTRLRLKLRRGLACQGLAVVATKAGAYPLRYVEDFFDGQRSLGAGGSQTIETPNRKSFFTTLIALWQEPGASEEVISLISIEWLIGFSSG